MSYQYDRRGERTAATTRTATELPKRYVAEMIKGAQGVITQFVASHNSQLVGEVTKMMVRFKFDLERRGYVLRDPKAMAEDLLYVLNVQVTHDGIRRVSEVLSDYVSGGALGD